jgi:uroporphyrinogen decarboxylase
MAALPQGIFTGCCFRHPVLFLVIVKIIARIYTFHGCAAAIFVVFPHNREFLPCQCTILPQSLQALVAGQWILYNMGAKKLREGCCMGINKRDEMTALERVGLTLQHKEADRVPVYPLLNGISRKLVNASYKEWTLNADITAEAYCRVTEQFGLDAIVTLTDLSVEAGDFGQELVFPENEAAHPNFNNHLLKDIEDYSKIEPIDFRKGTRMMEHIKLCDKLVKAKGKEYPIVAFVFGPLGILSMLRGQANIFMDILDDPDAVKRAVAAINQTLMEYVDGLIETGVNAIMLDTLFASQSIMSKSMWKEFEGVYVKELADHIHEKGCMMMIHNCGNGIYFDVQIEAMRPEAISFLHLPDDCKSREELKAKYGNATTLIGHVDPTWIIHTAEEDVREECRKQIDLYKKDGGFILATGCEYPANADFRNAEVMIEEAKTYGRYR